MADRICMEDGCDREVIARDRCGRHYQAWRKQFGPGEPLPLYKRPSRPKAECSETGCAGPVHAQGWCKPHWQMLRPRPSCTIDGCKTRQKAMGWCSMHYQRYAKYGDPLAEVWDRVRGTCSIDGCGRPHMARGLCKMHYSRSLLHDGETGPPGLLIGVPLEERVWHWLAFGATKYDGTFCLEWQGAPMPIGYAQVADDDGTMVYLHRWMYERWVGPIPDGLHIDHLCMNKICCNVLHLEPVTSPENTRRYWAAVREGRVTPRASRAPV